MHQIRNTRQLRTTISHGQNEFRLILQDGLYSRKTIRILRNSRFKVVNHIDNSAESYQAVSYIAKVTLEGR